MRLSAKPHKCSSLLVVSFLTGPTLPGVMAPTEQRGCKERQEHLKSIFIEPSLVTAMMSVNTTHLLRSNKSLMELKKHYPTVSWVNHWKFSLLPSHTAESDLDTGLEQDSQKPSHTDRCALWVLVSMAFWQNFHALLAMKILQEAKGATWKPHHSI